MLSLLCPAALALDLAVAAALYGEHAVQSPPGGISLRAGAADW
jgi:hypothetical protein